MNVVNKILTASAERGKNVAAIKTFSRNGNVMEMDTCAVYRFPGKPRS